MTAPTRYVACGPAIEGIQAGIRNAVLASANTGRRDGWQFIARLPPRSTLAVPIPIEDGDGQRVATVTEVERRGREMWGWVEWSSRVQRKVVEGRGWRSRFLGRV